VILPLRSGRLEFGECLPNTIFGGKTKVKALCKLLDNELACTGNWNASDDLYDNFVTNTVILTSKFSSQSRILYPFKILCCLCRLINRHLLFPLPPLIT
jgi:hypothetical protein